MASIFTKIIRGEEPGEIVYQDDQACIILSRAPHKPGHSLVVPRREVEFFYEMEPSEYAQLMDLARGYAVALERIFSPTAVAMQIMGLGVPHVHVHLVPIDDEHDMDQVNAVFGSLEAIAPAAEKIRIYLAEHPLSSIQ